MNSRIAFRVGAVILLLVIGLAGYLYGVSSRPEGTTTTIITTSQSITDQITDAFAKHMLLLSERNPSAIQSQYAESANVTWMGNSGGLAGVYNRTDILILMKVSFIGRTSSFSIGDVAHKIDSPSPAYTVVHSNFTFYGRNYNFGLHIGYGSSFNGTVSARDLFVYSASNHIWVISNETWNFTSFSIQN
jgi:hypothetical protein